MNALDTNVLVRAVVADDEEQARLAVAWYAAGMAFADALHLSDVGPGESLVTFDRQLAAAAHGLPGAPAVQRLR